MSNATPEPTPAIQAQPTAKLIVDSKSADRATSPADAQPRRTFEPYVPSAEEVKERRTRQKPESATTTARRALSRLSRLDWMLISGIFVAALLLRLINLGNFPDSFNPDEADNFQDAIQNIHGVPRANGFFGFDWKPQPAYSVYMISAFIKVLGPTVLAVRLPSVLFSCLALIPFYILLRRQFSTTASTLATTLLATNLWYLNFSRSGWENVHVSLYMLMAMLCLMLALDRIDARDRGLPVWLLFAATGFFCALGLYGYFGGRAIIMAVAAFFPVALVFYRGHWRALLLGWLLTGAVAVVLFLPEASFILANWQQFNNRSATVLIFNSPDFQANPAGTIWGQISRNAVGPWVGSVNHTGRYTPEGEPLLDLLTGALVLAGIALSLAWGKMRRRPENWLWWIMLLAGWALTEVITGNTPDGARGVGWMPTLLYFAAAAIEGIVVLVGRRNARAWRVAVAATAVLVALVGAYNVMHYVAWQSSPVTREMRQPYVETRGFTVFAAEVIRRMTENSGRVTAEDWQAIKPTGLDKQSDPGISDDAHPPVAFTEVARWPLNVPTDEPLGIAFLNGKVYMADYRGKAVSVLDTTTGISSLLQPVAAGGAITYTHPGDIHFGPGNQLYVLNNGEGSQALFVMKEDGTVARRLVLDGKSPIAIGLYVVQDGTIYVADKRGGSILKYGPNGGEPLATLTGKSGGFNNVAGVTVDENGTVYAAENSTTLVHEFSKDGQPVRQIDVGCHPSYMVSSREWLDVSCDKQIVSINKKEGFIRKSRLPNNSPRFDSPTGLVYGPDGTLYVRDGASLVAYKVQH